MARVLAVLARRARARGRRRRRRRGARSAPSALETTLWATTSTSPGVVARRRASSAARSSPGRTSGRPASAHARSAELIAGRARASSPRVCAAPPVRAPSAARSAARSSAVSTSSTERARLGHAPARAAGARPPARGARGCPGRSCGAIASGGASSSALVPVPWRSGTMTTSGALMAPASSSSTSRGSSAGQSPGTSSTRSYVALERPVDAERARRASGRGRRRGSTRRRRPRASASAPFSPVTTMTLSMRSTRRSACEHVG